MWLKVALTVIMAVICLNFVYAMPFDYRQPEDEDEDMQKLQKFFDDLSQKLKEYQDLNDDTVMHDLDDYNLDFE